MNNFEEQLSSSWVEDEDRPVDGLGGEVTFECLVDCNSVHVGVINEPDDLLREQFCVILCVEVGLSGFRGIQLQTLSNSFSEDVEGWIGFHDFVHGLEKQVLDVGEPVSEGTHEVVRQINSNEHTSGTRVDGDIIGGVVEELGASVTFDIV